MKLYYFDAAGRAESIRLLLTHAGQQFEDVRIARDQWPKMKDQFELKQLPCLEIDGKKLTQSYAILEYLGAKFGYLPKNYAKLYNVLFIMNTCEDLMMKTYMATMPMSPLDEKAKKEALEKLKNVEGPLALGAIEKKLKENCCQEFLVGKKYTLADFYILGLYRGFDTTEEWKKQFGECIPKKFPLLWEYVQRRIKDFNLYLKKCKTIVHYFDMPGRGEMIRVLLKHIGNPFEDHRIKFEEWPALKASGKFELQQLPVIECDPCGINLCQTDAIMHRIGVRYGLLPVNKPEKLYKVVWFCNTMKDIMEGCTKFFLPIAEDKKKEQRKDFFEKTAPILLGAVQDRLKLNKCKHHLVGSKPTIADFYFIGVWKGFVTSPMFPEFKELIPKFPLLNEYMACKEKKYYS